MREVPADLGIGEGEDQGFNPDGWDARRSRQPKQKKTQAELEAAIAAESATVLIDIREKVALYDFTEKAVSAGLLPTLSFDSHWCSPI
jgi:hypothetical protein